MAATIQCVAILIPMLACCLPDADGLKIHKLTVPSAAVMGTPLWLSCVYELEGELHSVKWYKDNQEFYRFIPKDSPPRKFFPVLGLTVALHRSNGSHVFLNKTDRNTPGVYRCEVATDAPDFQTVQAEEKLKLIEGDSHVKVHESGIKRLRDHLFANYDRNVRPVHNAGDVTTVKLGIHPIYILDMSDSHRLITMVTEIGMTWHDEFLTWDPHNFEGIETLRVEKSDTWLPDIIFWSTLPVKDGWIGSGQDAQVKLPSMVLSNGTVVRWTKHTLSFLCDPKKEDPKIRKCSFMTGTWGSDGSHVDIESTGANLDLNIVNPKWKIDGYDSKKSILPYYGLGYPFVVTTVDVKEQEETDD